MQLKVKSVDSIPTAINSDWTFRTLPWCFFWLNAGIHHLLQRNNVHNISKDIVQSMKNFIRKILFSRWKISFERKFDTFSFSVLRKRNWCKFKILFARDAVFIIFGGKFKERLTKTFAEKLCKLNQIFPPKNFKFFFTLL